MTASLQRKYRTSEKRQATQRQNREAIEAAAWEVFCTVGFDGANIRDIVNLSGLSPGTFYNYYRTKEVIFQELAEKVLETVRRETRAARAHAATIEELLTLGYQSYLNLLMSIDGALQFIDRNQHHIRAQLYPSSAMRGITRDLEEDLRRFIPASAMPAKERSLVASILIAAGAEAIFHAGRRSRMSMKFLRDLLTRLMVRGLNNWSTAR